MTTTHTHSTTPTPRAEQETRREAILAQLEARWQREDAQPQARHLHELAQALCWAREKIAALLAMADTQDPRAPVLSDHDEGDGFRWNEMARDLAGWDYTLDYAEDVMDSHFTHIRKEALAEWHEEETPEERAAAQALLDGEDGDDGEKETRGGFNYNIMNSSPSTDAPVADEADTPHVRELPPAKGKPYWQQ